MEDGYLGEDVDIDEALDMVSEKNHFALVPEFMSWPHHACCINDTE